MHVAKSTKACTLTATAVKANGAVEQSTNGPSGANLTLIILSKMTSTNKSASKLDAPDVSVLPHQEKESSFETQMQGQ